MSPFEQSVFNFLGALFSHLAIAFMSAKLPLHLFEKESWWSTSFWFEKEGELWNSLFQVKKWKKKLPDAGPWFKGGFSKKKLKNRKPEYLHLFISETRRAEFAHWLIIFSSPIFYLFNPPWAGTVMVLYFLTTNAPCVLAQRVNRPFLKRLLGKQVLMQAA